MDKNLFGEKPGDDTGIQTRVWGPAGWIFLHSIAQNYPWRPTDEQRVYYYNFFKLTGNVLPCRYCRESYQKFINQPGTLLNSKVMDSRKSLVTWLYKIHNKINKKLGIKDHPTLKEVWNKYESFRSKCHKTPERIDKVKKGCIDPMSGHRKKCVVNIVDVDEEGNEFGKTMFGKGPSIRLQNKVVDAMKILDVKDKNDINEIRKKYRELVLMYHPDRPSGNVEKFKEITTAYQILLKVNKMKFGTSMFGKGTKRSIKLISIKKSTKSGKKLMATFETNGRRKIIHFGSSGMRDFTIMGHNRDRMKLYRQRHMKDLKTGNPTRAGYLSMFVLWNKPSLQASISDYRRRLNVYNRTGKFPTNF